MGLLSEQTAADRLVFNLVLFFCIASGLFWTYPSPLLLTWDLDFQEEGEIVLIELYISSRVHAVSSPDFVSMVI